MSAMMSFKDYYRKLYQTIGYPLTAKSAIATSILAAAEKRLGIKLPTALHDYYLVAGNERRFNTCHNRLLPPKQWHVAGRRLIFMAENQAVVYWGVSVKNTRSIDPAVWQGINDDAIHWNREHPKCSAFLAVMLHYQAVNDGLPFCATAQAPEQSDYRFEAHGWTYYGMVNSLSAYSRTNQVVCLMPPGDLPFMQRWSVLAGAKTKRELLALAEEIGVAWE